MCFQKVYPKMCCFVKAADRPELSAHHVESRRQEGEQRSSTSPSDPHPHEHVNLLASAVNWTQLVSVSRNSDDDPVKTTTEF